MRIYPTTTFTYPYLDEHEQIHYLSYHVVSFHEFLHDQNIDPFYIEYAAIITAQETVDLDRNALEYAYIGYLDDPKDLTLLFLRDTSRESWIFHIQDIKLNYKANIPNWRDEDRCLNTYF